jgi:glycosyltransferase involved in cell wall biosynthesis
MSSTSLAAKKAAAAERTANASIRPDAVLKVLLLNQCFYPDVVSTAQHAADLAAGLSEAGHQVTVIASRRAYDNPDRCFARYEVWNGIRILRVWSSGFGKRSKWRRAADFASFLISCTFRLFTAGRYDAVIAMTSPPLISYIAALFVRLTGGQLHLWVMDLNPDEAVAAGWLNPNAWTTRVLERMLEYSVRQADRIVVLDRFMKDRVAAKGVDPARLAVLPPWSHDTAVRYDEAGRSDFRARHGLTGKYVVMYSGNHSPCHPLDTLLSAALRLRERADVAFCFIGGGSEYAKVGRFAHQHGLQNIITVPYQPLEMLSGSLSAADLHVVVMGDQFVGIVHPCKVYNIVKLQIPFLYIGPPRSHVTDLLSQEAGALYAGAVRHGDVEAVERCILAGARRKGTGREHGCSHAPARFSQEVVVPEMVRLIVAGYGV